MSYFGTAISTDAGLRPVCSSVSLGGKVKGAEFTFWWNYRRLAFITAFFVIILSLCPRVASGRYGCCRRIAVPTKIGFL